jgi:hypothetical protein
VRAEKSRGWRIRSPSSRNELIEKHIRQKSPATPGFFRFTVVNACGIPARSVFLPTQSCPYASERAYAAADRDNKFYNRVDRAYFQNSNRYRAALLSSVAGLPCSDDQKKTRLRSHLSA